MRLLPVNRRALAVMLGACTFAATPSAAAGPGHPPATDRHLAEMLVLAPDDYADALRPLLVWKHRSGSPADLHMLSDFGNTVEDVQAWLRQLSQFLPREYILIVGDFDTIPSPRIEDANGEWAASDYGYTDLDEDGELGDTAIGRFPARNLADVEAFVARILSYERDLGRDSTSELAFLGRAVGIANDDGDPNAPNAARVANSLARLETLGVSDARSFVEGVEDWSDTELVSALESGVGHIIALNDVTGSGWRHSDPPAFEWSATDVLALEHGGAWPVIYDLGGPNGRLGEPATSMAEAWSWAGTSDPRRGAMATITWSGRAVDALAWTLPEQVTEALAAGEWRLGPALQSAREALETDDANALAATRGLLTLFGDPSLVLRHSAPIAITVDHPTQVEFTNAALEVRVTDRQGRPVEGALVSTSFEDHFVEKMTTNADGWASVWTLTTGVEDGSSIDVVVNGPTVVSYEGQVLVIDSTDSESGTGEDGADDTQAENESDDSSTGGETSSSTTNDDPSLDTGADTGATTVATSGPQDEEPGNVSSSSDEGKRVDAAGCHARGRFSSGLARVFVPGWPRSSSAR